MDRKKINTILIVAVVAIWGIVLYKFIASYLTDPDAGPIAEIPTKPAIAAIRKKDTVTLNFPERDPFLGTVVTKSKPKAPAVRKSVTRKPKSPSKPVLWPKIEYLGFVKSSASKGRLGLVRIDGRLHRVNAGTEVNGLRIRKISKDALVIMNGKEERSFGKN
ncbi:hypothetical protein FK220_006550 [Flavobacteriaceae bacterium TP-CH-4]|uniref:Type II secretion system protein GspC N-terminal domain-containing protein n=1 Tax=Pelagihabitans pacificus TaxID=2696054 RepID=A0A967AYP4_9FLAO|nr:hypothetical protein [Pelagihabitans pacificus]NHF58991.1 hypothetical protein [Pelagihabitans pacificus]